MVVMRTWVYEVAQLRSSPIVSAPVDPPFFLGVHHRQGEDGGGDGAVLPVEGGGPGEPGLRGAPGIKAKKVRELASLDCWALFDL